MAKPEKRKPKASDSKSEPPRPATPVTKVEDLSARHQATFQALYTHPLPADLPWRNVIGLLDALGAHISQREGSRIAVRLGGRVAVFHEPHPQNVTDRGALRGVRNFLTSVGVKP